jgi:creatinine amidohydrolase
MHPWKLCELNYGAVKQRQYEVAVLPFGATEPHNLHLPYGADTLQVELIAENACEAACQQGAKVVLLPTIPYGTQTNLMHFPLTLNVHPSTLGLVISDLVESLVQHGILKILLLNGHGGNDFKPVLRELYGRTPAMLFLCNWYDVAQDVYHEIFEQPENHAGEMETSLVLAYRPDLVARDPDGRLAADEGRTPLSRFEAINCGWVEISRPWHLFTSNAGAGNPHAASAEKGQRLLHLVVERLARFLVALSASPLDDRFPY